MIKKKRILFLSANRMGLEVFKQCTKTLDAEYFVMTLEEDSNVVMYDGVDSSIWSSYCPNIIKINSIREYGVKEIIQELNLDLTIMCGWRQVLTRDIMEIPKLGTIAFHPTPLPIGRGSSPIINSILEGWTESAVTLFFPDEGIDTGDIISQSFFKISNEDYAADVYEKCIRSAKNLVKESLNNVLLNKPGLRRKQDEEKATYCKKITLKDNKISLKDDPESIFRKIRAFSTPYLGAYIDLGGKKLVIDKGRICTKIKKF